MLRIRLVSAALFSMPLCGFAQQPTPPVQRTQPIQIQLPPQQPDQIVTLQAHARAVLVDVVITDGHGHAVHGLKPADFEILEDGKPQTIVSLEEHHAPTAAELAGTPKMRSLGQNSFSNRKPPATDSAATVLLLDALDSSVQAQMIARDELLKWVDAMGDNSGSQVAIFQLDTQLHLLQGFTSDHAMLKTALKDRYKPVLTAVPRGNGYVTAAMQMDVLTHAMQDLGAYLQTRPGRKNLVWFTTHIPRYSYDDGTQVGGALHDSQSFLFDYSKATDALVMGEISVYPIDTRGLQVNPAFTAANGGRASVNSQTRFDTRQFFEHTDLDEVAEATGGRAFYNTNGIKQAVAEVIETGSSYYTLSYYPSNKAWDGSYRKLKIETASGTVPSGAQLEYRRGYYATVEAAARRAVAQTATARSQAEAQGRVQLTHSAPSADETAFWSAMHLGAIDPGQIIFAAHADVDPAIQKIAKDQPQPKDNYLEQKYRDKPFRNYKLTYVVPGAQLELDAENDGLRHGKVEFATVVVDDKGALVSSASAEVNMHVKPETYNLLMAKGLDFPISVAVPEKGKYFLRIGVHDQTSGKSGTFEVSTSDIAIGPLP